MSADWFARKLGGVPAPTAQPQPQQQNYPGGPRPPQYIPPVPQGQTPQVTKDNIAEVAGLWKGGEATRKETARCPNCGGTNYFSVQNAPGSRVATQSGMAAASARCFECGHNDHHGLQTGAMG